MSAQGYSELRKRTPSSSPSGRTEKDVSTPGPKPLNTNSRFHGLRVMISLILGASLLAIVTFRNTPDPTSNDLPHSYALCSPNGRIVTVDENNPEVECLVVTGSYFSDVGSLGIDISF